MKGYHEYLELHSYFARGGEPRLSRAEFDALDIEFKGLAARFSDLDPTERRRLTDLKAILFRDKP